MWGPGVSEGGRGSIPVREKGRMGRGLQLVLGWKGSPGALFIFLFLFCLFFFCFLLSFISFAKMFQNHSNHFQKFSKNQLNVLKSLGNMFSKQMQNSNKLYELGKRNFACITK
jgi:hypothetical protein